MNQSSFPKYIILLGIARFSELLIDSRIIPTGIHSISRAREQEHIICTQLKSVAWLLDSIYSWWLHDCKIRSKGVPMDLSLILLFEGNVSNAEVKSRWKDYCWTLPGSKMQSTPFLVPETCWNWAKWIDTFATTLKTTLINTSMGGKRVISTILARWYVFMILWY